MAREIFVKSETGYRYIYPWASPVFKHLAGGSKFQGGNIVLITHSNDYACKLSTDETYKMIENCWQPGTRCGHWQWNACWGARQPKARLTPPEDCIGCQLRAIIMYEHTHDMRLQPVQERPWWLLATAFLVPVAGVMLLNFQAAGVTIDKERAEKDMARARMYRLETRAQAAERDREALRREKHSGTFRRQAAAAGAKRVEKGRKP
jgi:hypothetical protein